VPAGLSLHQLPALNAALNGTSAVLLFIGWRMIRTGNVAAHRACMLAAFAVSAAFLVSYLYYHAHVGSVRFPVPGAWRTAYLCLLASHTLLAAVIVPLILRALYLALRGRFDQHRRVARWTFPMWMYVSVTGVLVYLMLYKLPAFL